jgi:hypothetical protein
MIPKSENRFSEEIMLKQEGQATAAFFVSSGLGSRDRNRRSIS